MGEGRGERHGGVYQHTPLNRERKGEERVEDILAAGSNMESKIHSHTRVQEQWCTAHLEVIHVLILQGAGW